MLTNEQNRQLAKSISENNWSVWNKLNHRQKELVKEYMKQGHDVHSAIMIVRFEEFMNKL